MTKINYIVSDQVRVATFTNREDADLFWGVLQPLIKQGIITYAYIEDRCADLEDELRSMKTGYYWVMFKEEPPFVMEWDGFTWGSVRTDDSLTEGQFNAYGGKIISYIEDRCADLEDAARIVIEARDAERPLGETLANLAEVLERRP